MILPTTPLLLNASNEHVSTVINVSIGWVSDTTGVFDVVEHIEPDEMCYISALVVVHLNNHAQERLPLSRECCFNGISKRLKIGKFSFKK